MRPCSSDVASFVAVNGPYRTMTQLVKEFSEEYDLSTYATRRLVKEAFREAYLSHFGNFIYSILNPPPGHNAISSLLARYPELDTASVQRFLSALRKRYGDSV